MSTITIKFMSDMPLVIEYNKVKNMTIREFMLELGKMKSNMISGSNFEYTLLYNKQIINDFNNRHNMLKDYITPECVIFASCWILGGPLHRHRFENNLCNSFDVRNEICNYCDKPNNCKNDENNNTKFSCVLPCNHSFHYDCIASAGDLSCILCEIPINSQKKAEIIMMSK